VTDLTTRIDEKGGGCMSRGEEGVSGLKTLRLKRRRPTGNFWGSVSGEIAETS
jgi:hypothetical protein